MPQTNPQQETRLENDVRTATDADRPAVEALLEAAALPAGFDAHETLVLEAEGRIVATARLRALPEGDHELAAVAVDAARRKRGLGERIVRAALARATGSVYALALEPAFFARLGFVPEDELPGSLRERLDNECSSSRPVTMRYVGPDASRAPGPAAIASAQARVRRTYAPIALGAASPAPDAARGCCGSGITYSAEELAALPAGAHLDLGTGNPVRYASPMEGEVVLDLGSGAGVDVFLAARAVGPTGRAIGLDVTPEMVARARRLAKEAGIANAEFHEGAMERIPLPDASVDVVISNCVINLSADKAAVLKEARRVLKRGGRFVVSDTTRDEDAGDACDVTAGDEGCGCAAGALSASEWTRLLQEAGFEDVQLTREADSGKGAAVLVRARAG